MPNEGKPLNVEVVRDLMARENLRVETLAKQTERFEAVSERTINRALQGQRISERNGISIASTLGVSYADILHPSKLASHPSPPDRASDGDDDIYREWKIEGLPSDWITASNGLQYSIAKMRHREVTERIGRGKIFDLSSLGDEARQNMRHALSRHASICERVSGKSGIPANQTVCPGRTLAKWLIVDEWVDGETLKKRIKQGAMDGVDVKQVLTRIARTLSHLHKAEVLRRELSPRFIIMRTKDDYPILTDFELGKLFSGSRTVSNNGWKDDRYRAPEVTTGDIKPNEYQADLYSWGRIAVHILAGRLPDPGKERFSLQDAKLPEDVEKMILQCVETSPSRRPEGMDTVLAILREWT